MTTTEIAPKNGKIVGTGHVNDLLVTYKKERWAQNSARIKKADSLSTWYGMDELSMFLDLAKQHNADGIKMYYGVYPETPGVPEELIGRQTVVLVATKKAVTATGVRNKDLYIERDGRMEILGFNWGNNCPPDCTTGDPDEFPWAFQAMSTEKVGTTLVEGPDGFIVI